MGDEMELEITDLSRSVSFVLCRLCSQRHGSVYFPLRCVVVLPQISISMIRSKTNCSSIKIGWTHVWKKEPWVFFSFTLTNCFVSPPFYTRIRWPSSIFIQCNAWNLPCATGEQPLGEPGINEFLWVRLHCTTCLNSCMNMFFPFLFSSFLI